MSADSPRLRLSVVGVVVLSLFAALFARLWFLQVMASPEYKLAAERNQVRLVRDPAPRGRILDRHGRVVVENRMSAVVTVNRTRLPEDERASVLRRLAAALGTSVPALEEQLADKRLNPFTPVPVGEDVPEEVVVYIRENQHRFPGVEAQFVAVRHYPHGALAAHLVGYVGEINDVELDARASEGYRLGDRIGKSGVEQTYEDDLRGVPGIEKLEVDVNGRVLRVLSRRAAVPGNDIRLSVDLDMQFLAEESLRQGLESARTRKFRDDKTFFQAPAGSVVVLDVEEGSVVAMASMPTYEPAAFVNGFTSAEYAALTDPANHAPLTNRAIQGQYAPGSTFKLATAVAALRSGVITAGSTIQDEGVFRVSNCGGAKCTFRNAGSIRYGRVDVERALTVSSDVFFYTLGERFWERRRDLGDEMQETAVELGLGVQTGIPLAAERPGVIGTPDMVRELHEENPVAFPFGDWFTGHNVNLAIGQGVLAVTPLQLATAYATLATGGVRHAWNVAADVRTPDGTVVRTMEPRVAAQVDLPPAVRDPIVRGLVGATTAERGTAVWAFQGFPHGQFPVAGKTGTAQVTGKQDTALFAAFAPSDNPRYVVAVVMEQAGFGSSAAAPVARRILGALSGLEEPKPVEVVPGGSG